MLGIYVPDLVYTFGHEAPLSNVRTHGAFENVSTHVAATIVALLAGRNDVSLAPARLLHKGFAAVRPGD